MSGYLFNVLRICICNVNKKMKIIKEIWMVFMVIFRLNEFCYEDMCGIIFY